MECLNISPKIYTLVRIWYSSCGSIFICRWKNKINAHKFQKGPYCREILKHTKVSLHFKKGNN